MKLNIRNRIKILEILPLEGDFATMRALKTLKDVLYPSEAEAIEFQIVQEDTRIAWNEKANEEREINITDKGALIIIDALKKLDSEKKLTVDHIEIWDKFIGGEK